MQSPNVIQRHGNKIGSVGFGDCLREILDLRAVLRLSRTHNITDQVVQLAAVFKA
jgi:hypothetical protein